MIEKVIRLLGRGNWHDAHKLVQDDHSPLGYWAHGIVHLQEGDIENARYWYRKAKRPFPGTNAIETELEAIQRAVGEG